MAKSNYTILLVEDEKDLNNALKTGLEHHGFTVLTARDGEKGVDLLKNHEVDLVLLDVIMPFFDGVWFMQTVKANESMKDVPVIVLTNLTQGEKIASVVSMGANQVLLKADTSISTLVGVIEETLK